MSKPNSVKPPYYRLSDDVYASYFQRGFDTLQELEKSVISGSIAFDADVIGEATIYPIEFLAPSIFTVYDLTERELDGLQDWVDDSEPDETPREAFFDLFRHTTDEWRSCDVGSLRSAYFYHALTLGVHDNDDDRMRFGGFPPPIDEPFGSHHFPSRGRTDVPVQTKNWLAYDVYLTEILEWLRVPWLDIEDALLSAFTMALPLSYQKLLQEQKTPGTLIPIIWRHDLDQWYRLYLYSDKIINTSERLLELVKKIGYSEFIPPLRRLIDLPEPLKWVDRNGFLLPELLQHTKHNPPTLKAFYKALDKTLADRIEQSFTRGSFPTTAPVFVRRIYDAVAAGGGQKPAEFWQLCADIVYHLPILVSRLPQSTPSGDPAPPTFPTAEGFRSIVRARTA